MPAEPRGRVCRVFDDTLSLLHLFGGAVSAIVLPPWLQILAFILYVVYEVVEGRYRRDCPGADILEYLVGVGVGHIMRLLL